MTFSHDFITSNVDLIANNIAINKSLFLKMSFLNTIKHSDGEILTGRLWRKHHPFFNDLPFHTNIMRMDYLADALAFAFNTQNREGYYRSLLVVSFSAFISLTNLITL